VCVNANAALGNFDFPDITTRLALNDTSEHVRLAAMRALGTVAERMSRQGTLKDAQLWAKFLQDQLHKSQSTWREQAGAALALAQIFTKKRFRLSRRWRSIRSRFFAAALPKRWA
jgi:hypothetical protein